ncbi:TrmB family transcriptional regulator [Viridibacillus sp. YIM B01967]|uniref:TrmB family transcriptional regulator n=1 Tax=Viridibacillus soli TaxID=2798301 RepID=A0ABS1H1L0_9BACL|nr:TrmB family transcriptional regulator [Viridibacillus soli]MBK3493295.1 TrmB family transcriptional regulator [Viridibacillus soli]
MQDIIKKMQSLGFNQYEAKAYLALVRIGSASAYQVSKDSGIPRARIYEILNGLEQQGIVLKEEINDAAQYSPLPVDVFLESMQVNWRTNFESISESLKDLEKTELTPDNRVATLKGAEHILSYCRTLLKKAEKKIVISIWGDMYEELLSDLQKATKLCALKGIVFEVEQPLAGLDYHRTTSYTKNIGHQKWFILSIDGKEMIYGPSITERETAFYTDDPVHIYLLENYIWHDILVNRLVKNQDAIVEKWIATEREQFFSL